MAQRTITHFEVNAALMNDITAILFELPAKASRDVLNRIESEECKPVFAVTLKNVRKEQRPGNGAKPPPRKKKAGKKVAKRKRRS